MPRTFGVDEGVSEVRTPPDLAEDCASPPPPAAREVVVEESKEEDMVNDN